jgi:hypothetical protein
MIAPFLSDFVFRSGELGLRHLAAERRLSLAVR